MKNIYLGSFKFYQPKETGGGFLIFEWTLGIPWRYSHEKKYFDSLALKPLGVYVNLLGSFVAYSQPFNFVHK
jgi:hypothetical protein